MSKKSVSKLATTPTTAPKARTALQEWTATSICGSYSDIAASLGVCKSFVSRVLSGQRNPSLDTAEKMAGIMGLRLDEFAKMRRELASQPASAASAASAASE